MQASSFLERLLVTSMPTWDATLDNCPFYYLIKLTIPKRALLLGILQWQEKLLRENCNTHKSELYIHSS